MEESKRDFGIMDEIDDPILNDNPTQRSEPVA
jgi:hypothetical protein